MVVSISKQSLSLFLSYIYMNFFAVRNWNNEIDGFANNQRFKGNAEPTA